MTGRTRRSVLTTVASGAAVAAVAVGAAAPSSASASGTGPRTLSLTGTGLRRLDARPATVPGTVAHPAASTLPRAGDRCLVTGTVTPSGAHAAAGPAAAAGTFYADVVVLVDHGRAPEHGAAATYEQHLLTLPEGTIVATGTLDRLGRGTLAVVGGTGAWAGARGTCTVEQHRLDLGGDGRALFHLSLDR